MQFRELQFTAEHLELLDHYQAQLVHSQFLQSAKWGNFQSKRRTTVKLFSDEQKKIILLAIKQSLPLGFCYYYIPRGPYIKNTEESQEFYRCLGETIRNSDNKAIFVRVEPVLNSIPNNLQRTVDVQPSKTLLLSLKESESEILGQMHQKTRYNIRLAEKKNLIIKNTPEYSEQFLDLLEETKQRDSFRIHSRSYYQRMIEGKTVDLITVWTGDTLLAGSLLAKQGDTVTYVHGASSSENRELMAPYFLHWQSIVEAKKQGYAWYDWQGIDEKKWPGVTRFKQGFGGEIYIFPGTFDLVLVSGAYAGYTIFRRLRRLFF
jgi:peptidoglycan pentaglycine glycine transferase (the first glycine)